MLKKFITMERVILVIFLFSISIIVVFFGELSQMKEIREALPDDYGVANADITECKEINSEWQYFYKVRSYSIDYEYIVDGKTYKLNHNSIYQDKNMSRYTQATVFYEKDNPENNYILVIDNYSCIFFENRVAFIAYSEHFFDSPHNVREFVFFLLAVVGLVISIIYFAVTLKKEYDENLVQKYEV